MLKVNWIEFKNFQSYGNVFQKFDLDTGLKSVIVGVNGHGKSTMINALSYVWFNKSFIGGNLSNPRLINSINKKELVVWN